MKNNIYKSVLIIASISLFIGCKPNLTAPTPSKGSIDPTKYVAVGSSITSGFADGALYYNGQQVSYPNLIAQQLKLIGGSATFTQPLASALGCNVTDSAGHIIYPAPFKLGYSTDCLHVTSLAPIPAAEHGDASIFTNVYASQGSFNNMGVPGARAVDVATAGYASQNPFFARMASSPSSSMLSDAMRINATFFSLFIGIDDALLYATNGGAAPSVITSQSAFDASINATLDTLTKHGAKGVVANIPDITALPFFTTIPWNGLTLDSSLAAQLNAALPFLGITYTFKVGNNPFVIYDASVNTPSHARVIEEGELILLDVPLDQIKCHKMGTLIPIPNQYVLTKTEITNIQTAVSAYNTSIKSAAQAKGLAFVDVNAFLNQTTTGFVYNGINFNAAFVTGGVFSLDGVNFTPIGNALLANEFIKAINATYNSTIPQVDPTKYHGIIFP